MNPEWMCCTTSTEPLKPPSPSSTWATAGGPPVEAAMPTTVSSLGAAGSPRPRTWRITATPAISRTALRRASSRSGSPAGLAMSQRAPAPSTRSRERLSSPRTSIGTGCFAITCSITERAWDWLLGISTSTAGCLARTSSTSPSKPNEATTSMPRSSRSASRVPDPFASSTTSVRSGFTRHRREAAARPGTRGAAGRSPS